MQPKQLQSGKAAGLDHIQIEDIKNGGPVLHKALAQSFTWYIRESKIPKPWKTSKTILLFKKGVKEDIKSFRPICLLSHVYKLMTRVILNRIRNTLEENIGREQAGFRRGFSTIDHIHTINQLTEKCVEYQKPLGLLFIDFKKAFDSVEHNAVLKSLLDLGVEPTYIRIIQEINKDTTTQITLFNDPITINIGKGVRQGDVISPILFTSALKTCSVKPT